MYVKRPSTPPLRSCIGLGRAFCAQRGVLGALVEGCRKWTEAIQYTFFVGRNVNVEANRTETQAGSVDKTERSRGRLLTEKGPSVVGRTSGPTTSRMGTVVRVPVLVILREIVGVRCVVRSYCTTITIPTGTRESSGCGRRPRLLEQPGRVARELKC